jgi:hypothetical protein
VQEQDSVRREYFLTVSSLRILCRVKRQDIRSFGRHQGKPAPLPTSPLPKSGHDIETAVEGKFRNYTISTLSRCAKLKIRIPNVAILRFFSIVPANSDINPGAVSRNVSYKQALTTQSRYGTAKAVVVRDG